jgi:hypothetical protein
VPQPLQGRDHFFNVDGLAVARCDAMMEQYPHRLAVSLRWRFPATISRTHIASDAERLAATHDRHPGGSRSFLWNAHDRPFPVIESEEHQSVAWARRLRLTMTLRVHTDE